MSRFCYAQSVNILDLGYRPTVLQYFMGPNAHVLTGHTGLSDREIMSRIICWPLIAASSVQVKIPDMPFIPDYIVPQLLLQWLRNNKNFDGLRYFSTRINRIDHSPWAAMNYVFPVKEVTSEGYCQKLQNKFYLTAPCAWSVLSNSFLPGPAMQPDP